MAINQETFNTKLYELLKVRGYDPIPKDVKNQRTTPKKADVFNFTFKKDGKEYGNSWVTIDDANNVIVYYDQEQYDSPEGKTAGLDYDDSWTGFLKHLKHWAMTKQMSFELAPKDKLGDDMARREETQQDALNEGYYPINKTASYSDAIPSIKIILQHTRQIQEGEQRFRNISKIFLENEVGERILAPTTRPGVARVYARHLAEGGLPHDDRWNHISGLVEEYTKMAGFVRATRGNTFNESATKLVEAGMNHYLSLRETLGKLTGHRGYSTYFESYTPPLMEDDTDAATINELFVQETLDPRIESVMPILNKLQKQISEMSEMKELEEWADNVINEKMDSTTASMAVPADKMLDEAPGAETLTHNQNTEKSNLKAFDLDEQEQEKKLSLGQYQKRAAALLHMLEKETDYNEKKDIEAEIESLIAKAKADGFAKHEIMPRTSSKTSEPKKAEKSKEVGVDDGSETKAQEISKLAKVKKEKIKSKFGLVEEETDDAEEAHKKIQTPAYLRKEKVTLKDLEKAKERSISSPEGLAALKQRLGQIEEQEVEESGLQAYLGNKKYGKEGMDALRKAGREHASKEKMASIRAKYDKLDEVEVAEDLDADQKRVGQLGPTEKVGPKGAVGKLVGANESRLNEMDSEGYKGHRGDEDPGKGPEKYVKPAKAKDVAKDAEKELNKSMDKAHKKDVKEGQEELESLLKLLGK